jgi:hypothetical protein
MALKKTLHGEKLQQRVTFSGVHAKTRFKVREVFCPRCCAKPQRKCQWKREDLVGEYCIWTRKWWGRTPEEADREARRRNRTGGGDHQARGERAQQLTALAQQGRPTRAARELTLPLGEELGPSTAAADTSRESKNTPLYRLAVKNGPDSRHALERFDHLPLFATRALPNDDGGPDDTR